MALPPIPTNIESAMGAGGPQAVPMDQSVEVALPQEDMLPPGIEMMGEEMMEVEVEQYVHDANLAEILDDDILSKLANDCIDKFEDDKESRSEWEEAISKGLTLMGINYEERSEPFLGASGVHHPLLSEAVTQFQAQTYKELLPAGGPVKTQIVGQTDRNTEDQAQRVKDYMNYQITEVMEEYDNDTDQMLYYLPLTGSTFKKVYWDYAKNRAVAKFVPAEDFVVPYSATDLRTCGRYTHVVRMSENDVRKLQVAGVYRDVDIRAIDGEDAASTIKGQADEISGISPGFGDDMYTILEAHVDLDLEGFEDIGQDGQPTGIKLPYIVTVDEGSGEVLSVVRNWREVDPLKRKRDYFVHYKFLPGFGFYGFGLLHTIGGLSRAATSILRQLIDAGTLSNLPGGFKARGVRIRNDDEPVNPGEFRDLDAPGGDIRNAIIPLPYKEPSGTLAQLLGVITESGRRFAQVADTKIADVNSQAPVGTTVALIEQGSKVISSIHKRLHYAQKNEFRLLAEIFAEHPEPYPFRIAQNVDPNIMMQDFDGRVDILPVSDPSIFSMAQRLSLAQTQLQLAQAAPQMHNMYEAYRRMYDALDVKNIDNILPPPPQPQPMDPAAENAKVSQGKQVQVFPEQDHEAHIRSHAALIQSGTLKENPAAMAMLQGHIQEHVSFLARMTINQIVAQMAMTGQMQEQQATPQVIEAMVAGQVAEILERLQPLLGSNDDPLVEIRNKELSLQAADLERKAAVDEFNLEMDEAKMKQSFELAQQRIAAMMNVADQRNDTNLYRINMQAAQRNRR